jgi:anaerobic magnesium-protoporphyrin IX monomethyl ester cyclase
MVSNKFNLPIMGSVTQPAEWPTPQPRDGRQWRVLLINPPFQRLKGVRNLYFPLGLGYLAGSLKAADFACAIYNAENPKEDPATDHNLLSLLDQHHNYMRAIATDQHPVWDEVRATIRDYKPDIVGLSVMTPIYGSGHRINRIVKELFPECRIIWGGPHPTAQATEVLDELSDVDFTVQGEGEETMVELCREIAAGQIDYSHVTGIGWRSPNGAVKNAARSYVENLDDLPWPDKTADLHFDYYLRDPERAQIGNLFGSRGCPFKCAYCSSHTLWSRRVRVRSPENVVAEMKYLKENFGVERFSFLDDTFTMHRKWASAICERMISEKLDVRWGCYTRLDVLTEELLLTMKKAGLAEVDVGVETGSQRMADFLQKNIKLDRVRDMAKVLNKRRVNWNAFIMMGLPTETREDIQATLDFVHEIRPIRCILSVFTPYPGDALYDYCVDNGLIVGKPEWSRFSHHSPENCFVDGIAKEDFEPLVLKMFTLIEQYNNSFAANYRLLLANFGLYTRKPGRFAQKAANAARRVLALRTRKLKPAAVPSGTADLVQVSGRGSGI